MLLLLTPPPQTNKKTTPKNPRDNKNTTKTNKGMMGEVDRPVRQALVRATLHLVNRCAPVNRGNSGGGGGLFVCRNPYTRAPPPYSHPKSSNTQNNPETHHPP
jgi:hypothetical protein